MGGFLRQLYEWAEKPCVLTIRVASGDGAIRVSGILRPYYSVSSLHGWALVPPQQHGGFAAVKLTQLHLAEMEQREVVLDGYSRRLRFSANHEIVFELERDDGVVLTAPPRTVRNGRYLYVGGRRRRLAEPWMLQ